MCCTLGLLAAAHCGPTAEDLGMQFTAMVGRQQPQQERFESQSCDVCTEGASAADAAAGPC